VCELLGVSVAPAGQLGVYFHQFRPRADENQEGWGVAWWDDGWPRLVKEPARADESELAAELAADPPTGTMFIVHVRAATIGDVVLENTHPFAAAAIGRDWAFAHNGTVKDLERLDTGHFVQAGATDSEQSFHHLLTALERLGSRDDDSIARQVLATGRQLSSHDSLVNFLLSDGRTLFAYHDGHKTLHFIEKRAADLGEIGMSDDDYRLALRLGDDPDERAVVVASVPLTDEPGWQKLEAGEFLVIRDGVVAERVAPGGELRGSRAEAAS
jgi:predicted glutamine amidotransferase